MRIPTLRTEFDHFIANMSQHTDLLVKIMKAKGIVLSPDEERGISPRFVTAEKKQIHEAFVLKICATWEILAEDVFVECLLHNTSKYKEQTGITLPRKKLTRDICKGLVSGLGYFSFRDAGDLKGKAKKFLAECCNPFKKIPSDTTTKINKFYLIRNYIAHRSSAAEQSLKRMYKRTYKMRFRPPGNFLFDIVKFIELGEKGEQIRFANYSEAFEKAAEEMSEFICPIPKRPSS